MEGVICKINHMLVQLAFLTLIFLYIFFYFYISKKFCEA
jgi:hypothetical protein